MKRKDAVDFLRERQRIKDLAAHLESLKSIFDSTWLHRTEVHPMCPYIAATVHDTLPGVQLFVLDVSSQYVAVSEVLIDRIEMREAIEDSLEPVIIDKNGNEHSWPSLGVAPDYETGQWGSRIPIRDGILALVLAINWLEYEYGQPAADAVRFLRERLERHGFTTFSSTETELLAAKTTFHC